VRTPAGATATSSGKFVCKNLALTRALENMPGTVVGFIHVGMIASIRGDHERAAAAFEENLRLTQEMGTRWPRSITCWG
jgi:hypothetical protein